MLSPISLKTYILFFLLSNLVLNAPYTLQREHKRSLRKLHLFKRDDMEAWDSGEEKDNSETFSNDLTNESQEFDNDDDDFGDIESDKFQSEDDNDDDDDQEVTASSNGPVETPAAAEVWSPEQFDAFEESWQETTTTTTTATPTQTQTPTEIGDIETPVLTSEEIFFTTLTGVPTPTESLEVTPISAEFTPTATPAELVEPTTTESAEPTPTETEKLDQEWVSIFGNEPTETPTPTSVEESAGETTFLELASIFATETPFATATTTSEVASTSEALTTTEPCTTTTSDIAATTTTTADETEPTYYFAEEDSESASSEDDSSAQKESFTGNSDSKYYPWSSQQQQSETQLDTEQLPTADYTETHPIWTVALVGLGLSMVVFGLTLFTQKRRRLRGWWIFKSRRYSEDEHLGGAVPRPADRYFPVNGVNHEEDGETVDLSEGRWLR